MLKILALGDVCGAPGTEYLLHGRRLARFKGHVGADMVIVNGENSAEGNGILPTSAEDLFEAGADVSREEITRGRDARYTLTLIPTRILSALPITLTFVPARDT